MSRSWLDRRFGLTTLHLSAGAAVVLTKRAAGEDALDHAVRKSDGSDGSHGNDRPPWQSALELLEQLLGGAAKPSLAHRIKIVIGNDLVRYVLLPWSETPLSEAERMQLAHVLLAERYGNGQARHEVAIEAQRFGKPALAAGIEAEPMALLNALMTRAGFRLVSLVPALVESCHVHRRHLGKHSAGWIVDGIAGRLTTLAFAGGSWLNVSNQRLSVDTQDVSPSLLPVLRRDAIRFPALFDGKILIMDDDVVIDDEIDWPVVRLAAQAA